MDYCRKFEIILVSADNLPNVRKYGRMRVYAEVSLTTGESEDIKKTHVDAIGETNPRWNSLLDYTIDDSSTVKEEGLEVVVKLYCERTMGERYIGEVRIPVKSLFDSGVRAENVVSYDVEGTDGGKLNVLYSFRDRFLAPKYLAWAKGAKVVVVVVVKGTRLLLTGNIRSLWSMTTIVKMFNVAVSSDKASNN